MRSPGPSPAADFPWRRTGDARLAAPD